MRHDVCASAIKETNTCLLSYRDGIERFCAGNTTAYPNTFNKQRIKERNSGVQFHYFLLLRIRTCSCKCFSLFKLKTDRVCCTDTCFVCMLCTCVQPPTPAHITLAYRIGPLFDTFLTIKKKEIRL